MLALEFMSIRFIHAIKIIVVHLMRYGGRASMVVRGVLFYSEDTDQRIYAIDLRMTDIIYEFG